VQLLIFLSLVAALLVCFVLGANNASVCIRTSSGVWSLEYLMLAIVGGLGVVLGTIIEGPKLSNSIYGGVLANQSDKATAILLLATLIVMLVATTLKLPLSLTQAMVGAALPVGLSLQLGVNWSFLVLVGASWISTPLVAGVFSIALHAIIMKTNRRIGDIFQRTRLYVAVIMIGSFYAGYALGANGVGLIQGISLPSIGWVLLLSASLSVSAVAGIFLFGYGVTRTVSERILTLAGTAALAAQLGGALTVHLFTQFGAPVSIIQAVIGGIIGIGWTKDIVIMNTRVVLRVVLGWMMAPLIGLGLASLLLALT